jgi:hypothetical protein
MIRRHGADRVFLISAPLAALVGKSVLFLHGRAESGECPRVQPGRPRAAEAHLAGRLGQCLALVVAKMEQALLVVGQLADHSSKRLKGAVLPDGELRHPSTVPASVVAQLTPIDVAGVFDSKMMVGAPAEPVLCSNAVDDRAANPMAGERAEWDLPRSVEPRGRFDKALRAVGDEIVKLKASAERA